ncbi:MAG TPA: phosphoenolpyruvate--protein phosphotransferase [Actinomycetota bacterium]
MVGIVIVSHSHRIAEGVVELAREMGGPDLAMEAAGGLAMPDHPIGTDAVLVMEAIERVWSDDGVLVLMDLGSAVLSAEMAIDLLAEERRSRIRLCAAPLVEGAVAAAVTARAGGTLDEVEAEANGGLAGKVEHLGAEAGAGAAPAPPAPVATVAREGAPAVSIQLIVTNPHGLHARPAARFVQTASGFDATVQVRNLTTGAGPASARSLNGVATLGIERGHRIEVSASGADADRSIAAIEALAARGFGEHDGDGSPAPPPGNVAVTAPGTIVGLPASPGIALGAVRRFHTPEVVVPPDLRAGTPDEERRRLDEAVERTGSDIERQRRAVAARAGGDAAGIFEAHALFLRDEALLEPARLAIDDGRPAAIAWRDAVSAVAASWEGLDDPYQRARAEDVRSVGRQVLAHLLAVPLPEPRIDEPGILVAADLAPAETSALDPVAVQGIVTAFGGPTSHASVLARSLAIPAVVGAGDAVLQLEEGSPLAIDGGTGAIYADPDPPTRATLDAERTRQDEATRAASAAASRPAVTSDGTRIEVALNIGSPGDASAAAEVGADGVGLFRTELLFMRGDRMPTEDEQVAAYRDAARSLGGDRPMTVRTLDVGADKPLPYLEQPREANPFLGVRGLRLGLAHPELLRTQLRAILRVAADHPVRVMFPMVTTLGELRAAREELERARAELGAAAGDPEVGIMVEVPAAALTADRLAREVAFFSIGTNDLTQYVLAADRGNERVGALTDALHPAVLRLIERTVDGAEASGRWVGVCGELAADPAVTALLLGLGVRELSMSAPAVPLVKAAVREVDLSSARALAARALRYGTADEVRALIDPGRAG